MIDYQKCEHGLSVDDRTHKVQDQCQECDWCPRCEAVRLYKDEACSHCGRVWGEHDE